MLAHEKAEKKRLEKEQADREEAERLALAEAEVKPPEFDKTGATCLVTIRNSKPFRIWFRAGKEIGAEDV
jgi:hypothetical protein